MTRGNLENHLFRSKLIYITSRVSLLLTPDDTNHAFVSCAGYTSSLTWENRIKIAAGAAKGLAFLHGEEKPVIYRDFKTSNILLDSVIHNSNHPLRLLLWSCKTEHLLTRFFRLLGLQREALWLRPGQGWPRGRQHTRVNPCNGDSWLCSTRIHHDRLKKKKPKPQKFSKKNTH